MTILAPYDVNSKARLYVDSSPGRTQASIAHGEEHWRSVNHTSRSLTPTVIEQESNGIMYIQVTINKINRIGAEFETVSYRSQTRDPELQRTSQTKTVKSE